MYGEIPFWLALVFVAGGLALLAWSSDLFVDGAARLARSLGISPFIVGMVVIGFGTSAPELCVSAFSGASGHSGLSLGNAYGSCVFNIGAILGVSALIRPIGMTRRGAFCAGVVLLAVSAMSWAILRDGACSRGDAWLLLVGFAVVMPVYCAIDQRSRKAGPETPEEDSSGGSAWLAAGRALIGLAVLAGSSHFLVWGAVDMARAMGIGELAIGLTIIAAGTSLPELASAIASSRRGESDFVLGNIVGSNLFNTLAVVGLACAISPAEGFSRFVAFRDIPFMTAFSVSIAFIAVRKPKADGKIFAGRPVGVMWLAAFAAYMALVLYQECFHI